MCVVNNLLKILYTTKIFCNDIHNTSYISQYLLYPVQHYKEAYYKQEHVHSKKKILHNIVLYPIPCYNEQWYIGIMSNVIMNNVK